MKLYITVWQEYVTARGLRGINFAYGIISTTTQLNNHTT